MRVLTVMALIVIVVLGTAVVAVRGVARRIRKSTERRARQREAEAARLRERREHAEAAYVLQEIGRELERLGSDGGEPALAERLREIGDVLNRAVTASTGPFPVSGPCAEAIDSLRPVAGERELLYSESGDGRWLQVAGNRDLVRWAVEELFRNSTTHAGAWTRIAILAEPVQGGVLLSVRDDGVGLDRIAAARLYAPFSPRASSGGPGLGLYAVRRIVESMGGTIEARTTPGGGLLHKLRLPHPPEGPYGRATEPTRSSPPSGTR